jgi:hypothetical protein
MHSLMVDGRWEMRGLVRRFYCLCSLLVSLFALESSRRAHTLLFLCWRLQATTVDSLPSVVYGTTTRLTIMLASLDHGAIAKRTLLEDAAKDIMTNNETTADTFTFTSDRSG